MSQNVSLALASHDCTCWLKLSALRSKGNLDLITGVPLTTYGSLDACFSLSEVQSFYIKEDNTNTSNSRVFMKIQVR